MQVHPFIFTWRSGAKPAYCPKRLMLVLLLKALFSPPRQKPLAQADQWAKATPRRRPDRRHVTYALESDMEKLSAPIVSNEGVERQTHLCSIIWFFVRRVLFSDKKNSSASSFGKEEARKSKDCIITFLLLFVKKMTASYRMETRPGSRDKCPGLSRIGLPTLLRTALLWPLFGVILHGVFFG